MGECVLRVVFIVAVVVCFYNFKKGLFSSISADLSIRLGFLFPKVTLALLTLASRVWHWDTYWRVLQMHWLCGRRLAWILINFHIIGTELSHMAVFVVVVVVVEVLSTLAILLIGLPTRKVVSYVQYCHHPKHSFPTVCITICLSPKFLIFAMILISLCLSLLLPSC